LHFAATGDLPFKTLTEAHGIGIRGIKFGFHDTEGIFQNFVALREPTQILVTLRELAQDLLTVPIK